MIAYVLYMLLYDKKNKDRGLGKTSSNNEKNVFTRAYELKDIEKVAGIQSGVHSQERGLTTDKPTTDYSIADLHSLVKTYDEKFSPKTVNPLLLNKNETPKMFYHGTFDGTSDRGNSPFILFQSSTIRVDCSKHKPRSAYLHRCRRWLQEHHRS